jgi:hypothetical protein
MSAMPPGYKPADGPAKPLGTLREVCERFSRYNTAPDGGKRSASAGTEVLHGPGMIVEVPTSTDTISQAMVTMLDDDIAWPVLLRLCRNLQWKMVDLESGRSFG